MTAMLIVTLAVDAPPGTDVQGVKEALAMDVEKKYGDARVVRIEERVPEQMRVGTGRV